MIGLLMILQFVLGLVCLLLTVCMFMAYPWMILVGLAVTAIAVAVMVRRHNLARPAQRAAHERMRNGMIAADLRHQELRAQIAAMRESTDAALMARWARIAEEEEAAAAAVKPV